MIRCCIFAAAILFIAPFQAISKADDANIADKLFDSGVAMPGLDGVLFLPPTMQPGLSAEQRMSKLKALSRSAGWKQFSRKSAVAPVSIDTTFLKDTRGVRTGHAMHVAFVVHASLETLKDKDVMKQLFGSSSDAPDAGNVEQTAQDNKLAEADLARFGVKPQEGVSYSRTQLPLLKRVMVQGVLQVQQKDLDEDTIDIQFYLDPRFNGNGTISNTWSVINQGAQPYLQAYDGAAGYIRISRLTEIPDACLVEARVILHEPAAWFGGSNLLRSKLPLMIQEAARSFRRKLK